MRLDLLLKNVDFVYGSHKTHSPKIGFARMVIGMSENKKNKSKPTPEADNTVKNSGPSLGQLLAQARRDKGKTLEEISAAINIRTVQLRAIEEGNYDALPGPTYAVGFIRSYANHLGLDGAEMVTRFKSETSTVQLRPELNFPKPIIESRVPNPLVIGAATVAAIVVLILWSGFSSSVQEEEIATSLLPAPIEESGGDYQSVDQSDAVLKGDVLYPVSTSASASSSEDNEVQEAVADASNAASIEAEAPVAVQEVAPAPQQPRAPVAVRQAKSRVVLKAVQSSWIQISGRGDEIVYKGVLRPGERFQVPDRAGLTMITANAGGLEVTVDGEKIPPLGRQGDILRGIDLSPEALTRERVRIKR